MLALNRNATSSKPAAEVRPLTAEEEAFLEVGRRQEVLAFLKSRFADHPVMLDASPSLDLGIDSLEWVTLGMELEQRFGLTFPKEATAEILTVRDLLAEVKPLEEGAGARPLIRQEEAEWLRPRGFGLRLLGLLLHGFNVLAQRLYFRMRVEGEALPPPEAGPHLYVANHLSDLDPPVVAAAEPAGQSAPEPRESCGRISTGFRTRSRPGIDSWLRSARLSWT